MRFCGSMQGHVLVRAKQGRLTWTEPFSLLALLTNPMPAAASSVHSHNQLMSSSAQVPEMVTGWKFEGQGHAAVASHQVAKLLPGQLMPPADNMAMVSRHRRQQQRSPIHVHY